MRRGRPFGGSCAAALLAAACLCGLMPAFTAAAQDAGSVNDYRLPPGPSSTAAPAAGPIDPEVPVVRPTSAPAQPEGSPTPAPTVNLPAAAPAPQRTLPPSPAPRASAPVPVPTATAPEPTQAVPGSELASPESAAPAAPSIEPEAGSFPWLAVLGGLAAVLAMAGLAWWRMRARGEPEPERAAPRPTPAQPPERQPGAPAALPKALPQSTPAPLPHAPSQPLAVALEAGEITRSLVYATLSYRLHLTNTSRRDIGPVEIAGDLASAHASLSAADQLAPVGGMEALHRLAWLAPGETVTLAGTLRLALTAIRPIRQGEAMLFVPLARFRVTDHGGSPQTVRVFVVGEPGRGQSDALRPLRIDSFPGVIRPLGSHEILLDGALAAG